MSTRTWRIEISATRGGDHNPQEEQYLSTAKFPFEVKEAIDGGSIFDEVDTVAYATLYCTVPEEVGGDQFPRWVVNRSRIPGYVLEIVDSEIVSGHIGHKIIASITTQKEHKVTGFDAHGEPVLEMEQFSDERRHVSYWCGDCGHEEGTLPLAAFQPNPIEGEQA